VTFLFNYIQLSPELQVRSRPKFRTKINNFAFYARSHFSRRLLYSSVNNISNVRIFSFCFFSRRILPQSTIHHLQSRARFQYSFAVSFSPVEHETSGREGAEDIGRVVGAGGRGGGQGGRGPGDFWEFSCVCDPARLRG